MYMLAFILLALWLLGMVTGQMVGGAIHLMLLTAAVLVVVRIIQTRPRP